MKKFLADFFTAIKSRKFIAWVVSTVLLCFRILPAEMWVIVTGVYLGVNTVQNIGMSKTNTPTPGYTVTSTKASKDATGNITTP